jgi:hypothetical protein
MNTIKLTLKTISTHKRNFILSMLLDFVFISALVLVQYAFLVPTVEAQMKTLEIINSETAKLPTAEYYQLDSILTQNEEFEGAWAVVKTFIVMFLLTGFGAWIIFKTLAWWLSLKTIYNKVPFSEMAYKFPLLSLFWFVILFVGFIIYSTSTSSLIPIVSPTIGAALYGIFFLIVMYFASVSFSLIPARQTFKKTFVIGWKHAKTILQAYIINVVLISAVFYLLYLSAKAQTPAAAFLFILLLIIFSFTRIHIIVATWQKHQ